MCVSWLCSVSLGSPYYDNVRPLCYSDSDAVLLCFDISRPDTVDSALKKVFILLNMTYANNTILEIHFTLLQMVASFINKDILSLYVLRNAWHLFLFSLQWKAEIQDFCPSTRILLIGCKTDLRTDVCTRIELSNQKQTPISHEQVCSMTIHSFPRFLSPV